MNPLDAIGQFIGDKLNAFRTAAQQGIQNATNMARTSSSNPFTPQTGLTQQANTFLGNVGQGIYNQAYKPLVNASQQELTNPSQNIGGFAKNMAMPILRAGAATAGLAAAPVESLVGGGGLAGAFNTIHNIWNKQPLGANLAQSIGQGTGFMGTLEGLGAPVESVTNPIAKVIAPSSDIIGNIARAGVKQFGLGAGYGAVTGQNPLATGASFAPYGIIQGLNPNGARVKGTQEGPLMDEDAQAIGQMMNRASQKWIGPDGKVDLNQFNQDSNLADTFLREKYGTPVKELNAMQPIDKITNLFNIAREDYRNGGQQGLNMGLVGNRSPQSEPLPWETPEYLKNNPQMETLGQTSRPENMATPKQEQPLTPPGQAAPIPNIGKIGEQVRLARFAEMQKITAPAENLATAANMTLKGEDNNLFRQAMQHPEDASKLAASSSNPQGFTQLVKRASDFFDSVAASVKDNKMQMGFVQDYYPQIWDMKDAKTAEGVSQFMQTSNFTSGFTRQRLFQNIDEGLAQGWKLKNPNVSQDIVQYARSMAMQIGAKAAFNKANELIPGSMVNMRETQGMPPRDYSGQNYKQSPIPGAEATFVSPDLAKKLNYYNPSAFQDNPIIQVLDRVNTALKETKLGGGLFHAYRETVNYFGSQGATLNVPRLDEAGRAFIDPGFWNSKMQEYISKGTVNDASNMGITLSRIQDVGKYGQSTMDILQSKNPLNMISRATFGRLINFYKLETVDNLPIEQRTPEMGKQIEALYNGVNNEVQGTSKTASQLGRFGALAAQFNIGKLVNVGKAALTPSLTNPAANFARLSLAGTVLTTAIGTEILRKVITGNFSPDLKSAISHSILQPDVPLPYTSPTGKQLSMGVPGTDISDLAGAVKDPTHFLTARTGPLLSLANQIKSGQDFYGNPLISPYGDQGVKGALNAAGQVASAQLPIPAVQALRVAQGKENATTAALNTLGMRVHTSQTDPSVIYATTMANVKQGLNPNQLALWNTLHPQKKDAQGNVVFTKGADSTAQAANIYLNNPDIVQKELLFNQQLKSQGIQTNPIWDLNPQQRSFVWGAQAHLPGMSNAYTKAIYQQPWYQPYQQALSNYFSSISQNTGTTPVTQSSTPYPQASAYVQQQMNNKNWRDPQVQAYLNATNAYNNQKLTAMGLAPLAGSSSSSSTGGRGLGPRIGTLRRSINYGNRRIAMSTNKSGKTRFKINIPKSKGVPKLKVLSSGAFRAPTVKKLKIKKSPTPRLAKMPYKKPIHVLKAA